MIISDLGMLGEEAVGAEGVLKMNCKVLDSSQLKRYDKQEKTLAQEIHVTGKGKRIVDSSHLWLYKQNVSISMTQTHFNTVKPSGHGLAFVKQRCSARHSDLCKIPICHGPTRRYSSCQRYEGLLSMLEHFNSSRANLAKPLWETFCSK